MNLTLFLGAGFSAPFGHPVMNSFLGFADACPQLSEDDRNFLGRLVLEARRANSFLESSPTNLEDILSFSEMAERLELVNSDENRNSRLRQIIQKIYTTSSNHKRYWERYKPISTLIGKSPPKFKDNLSIITTNYDLNIESACFSHETQVDPGFSICHIDTGNARVHSRFYKNGATPLYKLHGSVNWYPIKDDPGLAVEDSIVYVRAFEEPQLYLPRLCATDYQSPDAPIIVPPSFLKPDLPSALKAVWRGAAKALSNTNILAFVGYSFPPSDTEMMYFLASALSENAGLRAVYIVDPNADAIVSRLKNSNSKIGSHFRELIQPINSGWTEAKLPL